MTHFVVPVILILHCVLYHFGSTTRYLPVIVWDHLNPILSCKNNWLTIPKIDEYDVIRFKCPSVQVPIKLLDYSRISTEMNENIFERKWTGGNLDELKDALVDGSFCDPNITTYKVFTCENGKGESRSVTIKGANGYNTGDILVYYNNGDDGTVASLGSKTKKCSMVFVVNITISDKVDHDISYGKCLNPNDAICRDISGKCASTVLHTHTPPTSPSPEYTSPEYTSPTNPSPTHASTGSVSVPTSVNSSEMGKRGKQSGASKDRFGYGVLLGIACGCLLSFIVVLLLWLKRRSTQNIVGESFENEVPLEVCEKASQANFSAGNRSVKGENFKNEAHEISTRG